MPDKGIIQWSAGDLQFASTTIFGSNVTRATLDTFITALEGMTDYAVTRSSFVDETVVASPVFPDPYENTDEKVVIVAKDSDGKIHKWKLPRLSAANMELVPEKGERVTSTALSTLVGHLATLTGLTLTPIKGYASKRQ